MTPCYPPHVHDLNVYEETSTRLETTVKKVEEVLVAMIMSQLRKCAVAHVRAGGPLKLSNNQIDEIQEGSSYRYLDI